MGPSSSKCSKHDHYYTWECKYCKDEDDNI